MRTLPIATIKLPVAADGAKRTAVGVDPDIRSHRYRDRYGPTWAEHERVALVHSRTTLARPSRECDRYRRCPRVRGGGARAFRVTASRGFAGAHARVLFSPRWRIIAVCMCGDSVTGAASCSASTAAREASALVHTSERSCARRSVTIMGAYPDVSGSQHLSGTSRHGAYNLPGYVPPGAFATV